MGSSQAAIPLPDVPVRCASCRVSDPVNCFRQCMHSNFVLPPVPLPSTCTCERASSCKVPGAAIGPCTSQNAVQIAFMHGGGTFQTCKYGRYGSSGDFCMLYMVVTAPGLYCAHPTGARTGYAHHRTQFPKLPHRGNYAALCL